MDSTRTVLKRELKRIRRFAYSLTGHPADADDLVHDFVLKVLEKGIPEHKDPVPWMITTCKNMWIDELRYREVRTRNVSQDENSLEEVPDKGSQSLSLDCEKILLALHRLPDTQRLALSLVTIEGLTYAEAAKALDVPIGTIMSRVARARALLLDVFVDFNEVVA